MAGFGGAVKLTGESEYRQALQAITRDLSTMSNALRAQASEFNSSDKNIRNSAAAQKQMSEAIEMQQQALARAKTALAQYTVALQTQQTRHNALSKEYRNAVQELDRIEKESGETSDAYKKQAEVVDKLGQELADSTEDMNASKDAMKKLKSEINGAEKEANNAAKGMDELGDETEETGKQAKDAGEGFTIFKGIVANLASQAITAAVSGLKKLGGQLISVGKQAYSSYAEYEQLVGGVETLFGESADKVKEYAESAYKTAGMSANEYMEQVTSFSATLLQGLNGDTAQAAEYANMAMIDMSDNANKMGTSMQSIQNAYQGFAKQNYTMLDNLKLGYGGTQEEMARLINDSGVLGKSIKVNAKTVKDVPFNKIIEAIHKTQQQIGITGTTMDEASGTIEGSTKSVQASWKNLTTAIADENGDLEGKLKIFTDNVVVMAQNAVPRIKQVVKGMGEAIKTILYKYAPEFADAVVPFFENVMEKGEGVVSFVVDNAGTILTVLKTIALAMAGMKVASMIDTAGVALTKFFGVSSEGISIMSKLGSTLMSTLGPWGLVAVGVAGVTAAIGILLASGSQLSEETEQRRKEIDALTREIDTNVEQWNDLKNAQKEYLDKAMSEHQYYEDLNQELKDITYNNGKVKEGYEDRAQYITSELSKALGIEIEYNDGIIKNYQTMQEEIDKLMEKRQAQILLDSQESLYKEVLEEQTAAIGRRNEAQTKLTEAQAALQQVEADYATAVEEYNARMAEADGNRHNSKVTMASAEMTMLATEREELMKQVAEVQAAYDKEETALQEYAFNKALYEDNMAKFTAGKYSEMSTVTWDYVKDFQSAGDAKLAQLQAEEREIQA